MRSSFTSFLPVLFLFFLSAAPPAFAQGPPGDVDSLGWGLWSGGEGDAFELIHPSVRVCVQAQGPVRLGPLGDGGGPGVTFEPGDVPDCREMTGASRWVVEEARGTIRLGAFAGPARVLQQPSVTPLPATGEVVRVAGVSPLAEVTVAPGSRDLGVVAFAWATLQVLPVVDEGREWRVQAGGDGGDVGILVVEEASSRSLLRWQDAGWVPRAPSVGEALVPVALALLVALFRGGAGGAFVRPAAPAKRAPPQEHGS